MNIKLKKIAGDLHTNPGRTLIIIVALVIGLWGVGSILVSYTVLSQDLNRNFLMTSPPHAIMTSKNFGQMNAADLKKRSEIDSVEFRDFASLRIETGPDEWLPLWLYGVGDFHDFKIARIYDRNGKGKPPVAPKDGEIVVERDGLKFSDLKAGSEARIRSGGRILSVPVSGIVFDPAQAPGTQDHLIYAYADEKTFSDMTGGPGKRRLYVRFKDVTSRKDVERLTGSLKDYFDSVGIKIDGVDIPKFESHPHQWQLNTLLYLVGGIGFLAFLMGAVLVSQLMSAILSMQIRQIGILKAIGASRRKIFMIYMSMVLVLGIISGAVAIPLAVKFGFAYSYFVADILNFEILTAALPVQTYALLVLSSLLLPALLSLPAVSRGTGVSVLKALNDYGIRQDLRDARKTIIPPGLMPAGFTMAVRNTMRRKKRLAVTVISMAIGVAIFDSGFNVRESLKDLLNDVSASMRHDVQVVLINQMPEDAAAGYFKGIGNISRVEAWNGGRGAMQNMIVSTDDGVGIVSLPYDTDLIGFRSIKGRWLDSPSADETVMNQEAWIMYDSPRLGSRLTIRIKGKSLNAKLVGIANEAEKPKIYLDEHIYDKVADHGHNINSLMFVAKDRSYEKLTVLKRDIEKAIEKSDLQVLYVMMQAERVKIIYDHLSIVLISLIFFASLVLIVSAIGMASATSINIMERTREIGILRSIGAVPQRIYGLFVAEGMIVGTASIAIGLLLSFPLSAAASRFFGILMLDVELHPAFSTSGLFITLMVTAAFGWLASRIPARKAIKVPARTALSYE
jgi:putative ABC transport system permease protein